MDKAFKISIFVTSFFPLWLTILFKDGLALYNGAMSPYSEIIGICCILICNALSVWCIHSAMKSSLHETFFNDYIIVSAVQEKGITSEFLLSYILPLFAFDFTQWVGCAEFLIYYVTLAFLCIRNNNVYANLWLEVLGYKFYSCELKLKAQEDIKAIQGIVLSRENLAAARDSTKAIAPLDKPFYISKTDMD